jgi:hypothetical protein
VFHAIDFTVYKIRGYPLNPRHPRSIIMVCI